MSFSVTPASNFVPPEAESSPQFIQFQAEGTDLGGPDADTLNFTGAGVTATRGTGENENIVTVAIAGGGTPGGAASMLVVQLDPLSDGNLGTYNYTPFTDWSGTVLKTAAPDVAWDQPSQSVVISTAGLYAVDFQASLTDIDRAVFDADAMSGNVIYGTQVDAALSINQSEHYTGQNNGTSHLPTSLVAWADRYMVPVATEDLPLSFQPKIYGGQYHSGPSTGDAITCAGIVTVTKLA